MGPVRTPDGSLIDEDGRVLFFSTERFIRDICLGECCFICGCPPGQRAFNNEHILPRWILRRYGLFSRSITLPNDTPFRYDQYTVPCCADCNSLMGRRLEEPIRDIFCRGHQGLVDHLMANGPLLIFVWLALVFVKTHLKDRSLRQHRAPRAGQEMISHDYDWAGLHHVHCIARAFYTGCQVDAAAHGSMLFLAAKVRPEFEMFDFRDVYHARSILVRFDDFAIISVLDDGCGALSIFQKPFEKVAGAMSPIQLRETLGHLSYLNLHIRERAKFWTEYDPTDGLRIVGRTPAQVELDSAEVTSLGETVYACCEDLLAQFKNPNIEQIRQQVRDGRWTFLWDAEGNFDQKSMDPHE